MNKQTTDLGSILVAQIRERMVHDDACKELPNGFSYWIGGHRQEVTSEGPITEDEMLGWMVTIKTDYLRRKGSDQTGGVNALSSLAMSLCYSALITDEELSSCQLVSSVVVHDGNHQWIAQPLLQAATHQLLQCLEWPEPTPELGSFWEPLKTDPPNPGQPDMAETFQSQISDFFNQAPSDAPDHVSDEILNLVDALQSSPCLLCTGDENGLSAEFPFSDRTQLLSVNKRQHQKWGAGIAIQLKLPVNLSANETAETALRLSELETKTTQPGYLLGAWFNDDAIGNTLTATQFIPYAYCQPNLLTNYAYTFVARAHWVDAKLNDTNWSKTSTTTASAIEDRLERGIPAIEKDLDRTAEVFEEITRNEDAADHVFHELADTLGALPEPVSVKSDFFTATEQTTLFSYGIFNPMGPTWNLIMLSEHPKHDFLCLSHRMLNPFEQHQQIVATIETSEAHNLIDSLKTAFAINGSDDGPLLGDLPTWVFVPSDQDDSLGKLALQIYLQKNGPGNLNDKVHNLRTYAARPWDRASKEMQDAMKDLKKPSLLGKLFNRESPPPKATFEEYWETISDQNHLKTEIPAMAAAWNGALEFQKSNGTLNSDQFPNALELKGLLQALFESGSIDEISEKYFIKKD